jgi:hypothetical protein
MRTLHLPRVVLHSSDTAASRAFYASLGVDIAVLRPCAIVPACARWVFGALPEKGFGQLTAEPPVWADMLTHRAGEEAKVARHLHEQFRWRAQVPIAIPNSAGSYVTMFMPDGPVTNANKVCGVLPRELLLPSPEPHESGREWSFLPFFAAKSKSDLQTRCAVSNSNYACSIADALTRVAVVRNTNGAAVLKELTADGDVAIARDPAGAFFALFHRTDDPEEIKAGPQLQ